MDMAYTICRETSGNGARTGIARITIPTAESETLKVPQIAWIQTNLLFRSEFSVADRLCAAMTIARGTEFQHE